LPRLSLSPAGIAAARIGSREPHRRIDRIRRASAKGRERQESRQRTAKIAFLDGATSAPCISLILPFPTPCPQDRLDRSVSTSSQPRPPLIHWPVVGEGCAGPPNPSIRSDQASASARSASRMAFLASSRAPSALIFAPMMRPPQMTSRDLLLMGSDYSDPGDVTQRH
jgi:hypothetical protein